MVTNVAGSFATGNSNVGMMGFICFLPMAFCFASVSHKQTREHFKVLEARIQQLEADKAGTEQEIRFSRTLDDWCSIGRRSRSSTPLRSQCRAGMSADRYRSEN